MPIILTQKSPQIGIWKISEPWQNMLEFFKGNELYLREIINIRSDKRKQEWLAIRLLLQHLCGEEAYIAYHENGAPLLQNSIYNISISHTKGFATIILSENDNPAIDIEHHSERAWKLREKYLGSNELALFSSLINKEDAINDAIKNRGKCSSSERRDCENAIQNTNSHQSKHKELATVCWCAKETAYKAMKQTEVDFIRHLHILPFELSENGILLLKETKTPLQQTFYINYQINEDYIIAWKD